jgi:predicted DNA-binding transcriptional regulator YafY
MAKKQPQPQSRTDAERRVRQCERLGRLLRTLQLIMGKGRWDAIGLAEELECSRRTVYRLLQTLSMAGVPWYFDESCRAYRVRPGGVHAFAAYVPVHA